MPSTGYSQYSLLHVFSFSVTCSIQLSEAGYNLPDQSSSTSYYSVCMILISSNVVNERQNKFYSGLYQHHIRYKRKRSDEVVPHLAGLHPVSKFPNTLLPSGRFWAGELVAYSYTKLFFLRLIKMSFFKSTEEADTPLLISRYIYLQKHKWNLSSKPVIPKE